MFNEHKVFWFAVAVSVVLLTIIAAGGG